MLSVSILRCCDVAIWWYCDVLMLSVSILRCYDVAMWWYGDVLMLPVSILQCYDVTMWWYGDVVMLSVSILRTILYTLIAALYKRIITHLLFITTPKSIPNHWSKMHQLYLTNKPKCPLLYPLLLQKHHLPFTINHLQLTPSCLSSKSCYQYYFSS